MKAVWNGVVLAQSDDIVLLDGYSYFPRNCVQMTFMVPSSTHTVCRWKGQASYYSIQIEDRVNEDAAWYYPRPKRLAAAITDRIAFWQGVQIIRDEHE